MKPRPPNLPALYVEGVDDVSTIAALLKRNGIDTKQGQEHLWIKPFGSDQELLAAMADTIKTERSTPCGFVLDIDIEVTNRWQAVCDRLKFHGDPTTKLQLAPDATCPHNGYIGQVQGYPKPFGVWLMPDCKTDNQKLEHLVTTLIPLTDPLWGHARTSTVAAKEKVDDANALLNRGTLPWKRFGDIDLIKAEVRTWLSWQEEPGIAFGAAINNRTLGHDSPSAKLFLDWMKRLFGFTYSDNG